MIKADSPLRTRQVIYFTTLKPTPETKTIGISEQNSEDSEMLENWTDQKTS